MSGAPADPGAAPAPTPETAPEALSPEDRARLLARPDLILGDRDLMRALNAVRLVLGTVLDVQEDDGPAEVEASAEYGLYAYLSYMLDACVEAASSTT